MNQAKQGKASRDKGGRGERMACEALAEIGITARRSASMQAGRQSHGAKVPDLICSGDAAHLWVEVKSTASPSAIWQGIQQAGEGVQREGESRTVPVVLYKGARRPWVCVVPASYAAVPVFQVIVAHSAPDAYKAACAAWAPVVTIQRKDCPAVYVVRLCHLRWLVGPLPLDSTTAAT